MEERKEFILKVVCCLFRFNLTKLDAYLLTEICSIYYKGRISLTTETRKKIQLSLDTTYATFTNTLRKLEREGIIEKVEKINNVNVFNISNKELEEALNKEEFILKM